MGAQLKTVPWITETYQHSSKNVSPARTLNLYPEAVKQPAGKVGMILVGTPGTEIAYDLSTHGAATCRGLWYTSTGRLFGVYGVKVIEFPDPLSNGISGITVTTVRMQLTAGIAPVSMTDNGKYLVMADGYGIHLYNLTTDLSEDATYTFDNPTQVRYINNRVVAINNVNQFYWSDLGLDGVLNWDALSVASAESSADSIISMASRQGDIWLFGERSFEVWRTASNPDLPFSKVGGSSTEIGCGAPGSVASIADQVFWLGSSTAGKDVVYMSNGYGAKRISNHAIENLIGSTSDYSKSAVAFTYQQEGHTFYCLNLIDANRTLVFDLATGLWHERATRDPNSNQQSKWTAIFSSYAFGRVYVGNGDSPSLLELKLDKYDEYDGRAIVRIHEGPVLWNNLQIAQHLEFQVDMETGVGLQTGQGSDPQAMLQYSDDSGHTWSSEAWTTIGGIGTYQTRARWRRLGQSRARVYRLTISDPIKVTILGGRAGIKPTRRP